MAKILHVHSSRIEQWISRDQFLPEIFGERGKTREWTFAEVIRLAVFVRLVDAVGIDAKAAGLLTQVGFHGFKDDSAFLVAYKSNLSKRSNPAWSSDLVKGRDLGEFLTSKCRYPKALKPGVDKETIRENSKAEFCAAHVAIVVNLDELEGEVKAKW
ncbi:hypothetical protein [Methylocystis sp.]|uniref:hypothetical protein n=1 Tax=Methylocystis sp. TaxID=1911079 RepID=UPI003D0AE0CF